MDAATAAGVVREELGAPPEKVFDWFAPMPFAAASIGQVHAARLDGAELAVKIQYPGVADAIEADLGNTDLFAAFIRLGQRALGDHAPDIDVDAVVEEVRDRIGEELDYRVERANQEEFAALYRGHPSIRVPATVEQLTTARVLTMEMVDGRRWAAALESPQGLRDQWGEVIVRFVYGTLWRHGLFNADPHPGNYLFHEDGGVTFLDFGCVKRFTPELVDAMKASERAVLAGDPDGLVAAFTGLGLLPPDTPVRGERLLQWYRPTYAPLLNDQPYTYTREYAAEVVRRHFDPFGPWSDVTRRITVPRDVVFLNRIMIGLNSVLGILGATADWRAVADELRDDPEVSRT
jgi:predicted unusual protein kinase regulating ubiquinone biosynthesis (AarF/ABC1/UbiB family)